MSQYAIVVDDNTANLDALSVLLWREGITAITLHSPQEIATALELHEKVDVVFLDLEFPNSDGFQVVTQLQEDEHLQGVPIVAYSVHTSELNEVRAAGFHSFLGKPLLVDRFPDQIQRIMSGEHVWDTGW